MWKFQCKKHLLIVLGSFVVGAILFGVMSYQRDLLVSMMREMLPTEAAAEMMKQEYIYYLIGGITLAGMANGILLMMYVLQKYQVSFMVVFFIFFLGGFTIIEMLGFVLLIPAIFVCLYGMLTIPNRGKRKNLEGNKTYTVQEIERVYRLHHEYLPEYEELGKKAWKFNFKMNMLYAVGLVAILLVILYVNNFMVVFVAIMLYSMLFFQLAKLRAQSLEPIIALLYSECNPQACASAIFAYTKKARKKKNFPMPQHLAQCMIYLNDPHLAIDVLATTPQGRGSYIYAYHSLMAYAYYQLGDRSMVKYHYDECEKAGGNAKNGPIQIIKKQCLEGIQNKLDLMDQNFSSCRKYYEQALPTIGFEFQKVDFKYYLGLIAFVERDLDDAESQFNYVIQHGGSIYYVDKARTFVETIKKAQAAEEEMYMD